MNFRSYWGLVTMVLSLAVLGSSCRMTTYVQTPANVPLLEHRNELEGNVYIGTNRVDGQMAYAPVNNVGVAFSGNLHMHGEYLEGAAGYFNRLDRKRKFEIYGGYGRGYSLYEQWRDKEIAKNPNLPTYTYGKFYYTKYFIQPALGWNFGVGEQKSHEICFALRVNYVNFSQYYLARNTSLSPDQHQVLLNLDNLQGIMVDPSVTVKLGKGRTYLISQLQASLDKGISFRFEDHVHPRFSRIGFSVGIGFNFDDMKF